MPGQYLCDAAVGNASFILFRGDAVLETGIQVAARGGVDDIPHLAFPHLAVFALGHLVVGMHLDTQVLLGIDELHQQRQFAVILSADAAAQDGFGGLVDDRCKVAPRMFAIGNDTRARGDGTYLPAFADGFVNSLYALVLAQPVTAPDDRVQIWLE